VISAPGVHPWAAALSAVTADMRKRPPNVTATEVLVIDVLLRC
jgi:hypothetical protein